MNFATKMGAFAAAASLMACGGQAPPAASPGGEASAPPASFEAQAANGQALYAAHCASCHGDSGEGGGKAPRVVGLADGALPLDPPTTSEHRKGQFKTAADVAGFVVQTMPPKAPGSLAEAEYWAILAFDLKANGVTLDNPIDAASAASVVIHP